MACLKLPGKELHCPVEINHLCAGLHCPKKHHEAPPQCWANITRWWPSIEAASGVLWGHTRMEHWKPRQMHSTDLSFSALITSPPTLRSFYLRHNRVSLLYPDMFGKVPSATGFNPRSSSPAIISLYFHFHGRQTQLVCLFYLAINYWNI